MRILQLVLTQIGMIFVRPLVRRRRSRVLLFQMRHSADLRLWTFLRQFPVGWFIYGWTAHAETHWIGPLAGLALGGYG